MLTPLRCESMSPQFRLDKTLSTIYASSPQIDLESGTPIGLRARADLRVVEQRAGGGRRWAVKDPVSLRYFHLGETEMFLFQLLKRPRTCQELKERFEGAFPPKRITVEQIVDFCARLHAHHLLVADGAGQAAVLRQRSERRRRDSALNSLFGLLAIRLPGVCAEPWLARLAWLGRILFSRSFALAALLVSLLAALLLFGRAGEFVRELPTLQSLAQPRILGYFLLTMIVVKVFHELGHALACRRFGGECHEMGVMLLAFTPCLYCDVSDSWMFASRWQRIVVALAGIYVELLIASLAAILWYFSEPGLIHTISLYIIVTCTVSTIIINGNPLLRYDGYYVLSDLLGIPNLDEQSRARLWEPVSRWISRRRRPSRTAGCKPVLAGPLCGGGRGLSPDRFGNHSVVLASPVDAESFAAAGRHSGGDRAWWSDFPRRTNGVPLDRPSAPLALGRHRVAKCSGCRSFPRGCVARAPGPVRAARRSVFSIGSGRSHSRIQPVSRSTC